ncbi:EvpB family type VI secretion protein [Yersinia pseudotuberculosis]|nr:EvpB family type VI secretion protein [Yersinia pseudotuberculosis]
MSVQENRAQGTATTVLKNSPAAQGVYAALFEKINLPGLLTGRYRGVPEQRCAGGSHHR